MYSSLFTVLPHEAIPVNYTSEILELFEATRIKRGLQKVGWGSMDWIYLAQDGDRRWVRVNAIMNRWFP
jgi:hypothetical protein